MPREKESFSNIFEAAGKKSDEPHPKKQIPEEKLTDDQLKERYDRCAELHNLIQDKLEKAFSDHNLTQKQVREYFESPQHFSESQWRLIQEQKDQIKKQLKELVPEAMAKKTVAQKTQEQKKPKIMQTKSRWMPMH